VTLFETRKQQFAQNLDDVIAWRLATQNTPRAQLTDAVWNSFMENRRQLRAAQRAERPAAAAPASTTTTTAPPPAAAPWEPTWVR
jgi:hypothetical protein